jgi:lysophospholipase L1-like esterase
MQAASHQTSPGLVVRLVAALLIGVVLYLCVATLMFALAFGLLSGGIATGLPWLNSIQRSLNQGGMQAIWQNQPECVAFHEALIYRPKDGACRFRNVEFDTVLNFAGGMRVHKPVAGDAPGIAVLGDSHAMGWGVADHETFAAQLQDRLGRRVYNLAVSSYGTARELVALRASGVLERVDTVIIQYSDNDIEENQRYVPPGRAEAERRFAAISDRGPAPAEVRSRFVFSGLKHALNFPFIALRRHNKARLGLDFGDHYQALLARLAKHPELAGKRVLVFYINGHGAAFRNFPAGADRRLAYVTFVDLGIGPQFYFDVDDHMTPAGHRFVAEKLALLLKP